MAAGGSSRVLPRLHHAGPLVRDSESWLVGFGKGILVAEVELWVMGMGLRRSAERRLNFPAAAACEETHRPGS
jgi:hypothetical protein